MRRREPWRELESAELSYEIWLDALHAGVRVLEGYALDDRIGPRAPGPRKRVSLS
jgi:hypothetical protein